MEKGVATALLAEGVVESHADPLVTDTPECGDKSQFTAPQPRCATAVSNGDGGCAADGLISHALDSGVCLVKAEYLRLAPPRVSLDSAGKTRGMNKKGERHLSEAVQGTQRPTFEGESNFFFGPALQAVKQAVRAASATAGKRPRAADTTKVGAHQATGPPPSAEDAATGETDVSTVTIAEAAPASPPEPRPAGTLPHDAEWESVGAVREDAARSTSAEQHRERVARARGIFTDKLVLAPLTTVGNLPFRRICKGFGADVTVGEMAVVYNLNHLQKSEWSLLRRHESEDVFGIQIAVSGPRDAAVFADAISASGFSYDYIDINCGCPVDSIVGRGCGCGLWEKKSRLREVVQTLSTKQAHPVVIKCRIGPDENAPALHRQIGEYGGWGASGVTIHGRSKRQRYTKLSNWSYINECATLTDLPVIGNGDIFSVEDVVERRTSCPAVAGHMIGRGALIKPWIFQEIHQGHVIDISSHERFEMLKQFCHYGLAHWGADEAGVLKTRRFLCEWLSFLYRYVPVGLLERLPQQINQRPPCYEGRNELETLMASDSVVDWIRISELLLGPAGDKFRFTPKHKSNSYVSGVGGDNADAGLVGEG